MRKWAIGVLATKDGATPAFSSEIVTLGDKSDKLDATNAVLRMPKYLGRKIEIIKIKEVV
jgi:hypothetical protein